ncbi:MAG: GTPase Era [Proteobacteria bacterium]|nr:GTPase Era [Pseudomonadota bacterium]
MSFKSGFVSIVGRPNAGKSTLLNALLGEKISIISRKPQTTRNVIRGVKNIDNGQVVFLDTPGIHVGKGLLNERMVREAMASLRDVDAVLYMIEVSEKVSSDDKLIIEGLKSAGNAAPPVLLGINKVDKVPHEKLLPFIGEVSGLYPFKEIVPLSALKGEGVESLLGLIEELLPEGPQYFPDDISTDQPERFIAAEIVREKLFCLTHDEIPYSLAVVVERFKEGKTKAGAGLIEIDAVINVERESQKGIVIGKGGKLLKRVGSEARTDIEGLLGSKVFLKLFVRVSKDWTKSERTIEEFGH